MENMTEPQTPQERAKAKRLWKAYRWTWGMYWALGTKQGWACGICGRIAKNMPLNVDHEHFRVQIQRVGKLWHGNAVFKDGSCTPLLASPKKVILVAAIREVALPLSVRGLLCPGRHGKAGHGCCNRLLGRVDNPDWLEKARNYLLNPPAKDLDISPKS